MLNSSLKTISKIQSKKSPGRIKNTKKKFTKKMVKEYSADRNPASRRTNITINKRANISASHKYISNNHSTQQNSINASYNTSTAFQRK